MVAVFHVIYFYQIKQQQNIMIMKKWDYFTMCYKNKIREVILAIGSILIEMF